MKSCIIKVTAILVLAAGLAATAVPAAAADTSPSRVVILPEVVDGRGGARGAGRWASEVQIMAYTPGTEISATFYVGRTIRPVGVIATSVGRYELVKFSNLLRRLGELDKEFSYSNRTGTVKLETQDGSHPIVATVRTYSGAQSRVMQGVPLIDDNTATVGRPVMLLNLMNSKGLKSLAGFWNGSADGYVLLEMGIIDANDRELGVLFYEGLEANEQLTVDPFARAGLSKMNLTNVYLWINPVQGSGSLGVVAYGILRKGNQQSPVMPTQFN